MKALHETGIERWEIASGCGRVVWHLAGSGPPLLLVHGGGGSWTHWLRAIPELERDHQLLMPDLPGFGESDPPPGPPDPVVLAGIVREAVDQLVPSGARLVIVGFSFGGLVSGLIAEGMADRVARLVLVGTSGLGLPGSLRLPLRRWRDLAEAERETAHRHNLATLMICDTQMIDEKTVAIQAANAEAARFNSRPFSARPLLRDSLHRGKLPLGAIWGEKDAIAIDDMKERIAILRAADPACPVAIIPRAGHWVAHERPAAFASALRAMATN